MEAKTALHSLTLYTSKEGSIPLYKNLFSIENRERPNGLQQFNSHHLDFLNSAFSLSSWKESTTFWSLATNSMRREANVAKDKALALS